MSKPMALKPILSEKSHAMSHLTNTYMLEVPSDANKLSVLAAVKAQFGVEVDRVRIANLQGKIKSSWQRKRRSVSGQRSDTKRAYVTLKDGQSLPFFEGMHEDHDHGEEAKKPAKAAKETK